MQAIDYCINHNHMKQFLLGARAEVESMLLAEGSVEEYMDDIKKEKDTKIRELDEKVRKQGEKLQEKDAELKEKNEEIRRLKKLLEEKES